MSHIEDLYQKSKQENIPVEFDNLILNAAKSSCETPVKNRVRKWLYALPTAAVIMLSLSLILNLQNSNQITRGESEIVIQSPQVDFPNKKQKRSSQKEEAESNDNPAPAIVISTHKPKAVAIAPQAIKEPKTESMEPQVMPSNTLMEDKITSSSTLARAIKVNNDRKNKENRLRIEETINQDSLYSTTVDPIPLEETDEFVERDSQYVGLLKTDKDVKTKNKASALQSDIRRLEELIEQQEFKRAHELLLTLKLKYPAHDFKDTESKIQ